MVWVGDRVQVARWLIVRERGLDWGWVPTDKDMTPSGTTKQTKKRLIRARDAEKLRKPRNESMVIFDPSVPTPVATE